MSQTSRFWIPAEGIAREVIVTDIQQYLGHDALVRPGKGVDGYKDQDGYWIDAHRTLTSQMIENLKEDSLEWIQDTEERKAYESSDSNSSTTNQQTPHRRHVYASTPRYYTLANGRHYAPSQQPQKRRSLDDDAMQLYAAQPTISTNLSFTLLLPSNAGQSESSDKLETIKRIRVAKVEDDDELSGQPACKKKKTSRKKKALRTLKSKTYPRGIRRRIAHT